MKNLLVVTTVLALSICLVGAVAFGNPSLLPKHPGYPMGEFKDPVMGIPTANDPGKKAPSPSEALRQAGEFHDAHAVNPGKEKRPNVIHGDKDGEANS